MKLMISASEATIIDDAGQEKKLGFVGGAIILDEAGNEIASVFGSDEYSFCFNGIISYKKKRATRYRNPEIVATAKRMGGN